MRDQVAPAFDMNDTLIADGGSGSGYVNEGYLGQCDSNCYYEMDEGCCVLPESLDLPAVPIRRVKSASNLLQLPRRSSRSRKSSDDSAVGSADDSDVSDKSDNNLSASSSTETQDMLCATARTTMSRQPGRGSLSEVLTTTMPVIPSDPQPSSSRSSAPVFSSVLLPTQLSGSSRSSSSNSVKSVGHQRQMSAPAPPVTPPQCHFAVVRSSSDDHEMKLSEACAEGLPSSKLFDLLRPPSVVVSDHDLSPCVDRYLTLDDLDAEFQNNLSRRRLSDCSTCSTLSLNEPEVFIGTLSGDEPEAEETAATKKVSAWRRIRTIVHQVTPFIQTYKRNKYLWVQLAGHQGSFKPGDKAGTIKKKFSEREKESFELLMQDEALRNFVPNYYGCDNEGYLTQEDLLAGFHNPCVMDCKIGVRTYLEEELIKAKEKPKLRKDMYEKMCQIDPTAPTAEEHQLRGVTKPRYMVWRETISATSSLGFRIEGVRYSNGKSTKDFKTTKLEAEVKAAFKAFVTGSESESSQVVRRFLDRLYQLREALNKSHFFKTHEVIGSSLLFVHDEKDAGIWMIDFAKTVPLPPGIGPLRHDIAWTVGTHEDGYLVGIKHLIKIFEELKNEL